MTEQTTSLATLLGIAGSAAIDVSGLTVDSRKVKDGDVFFALQGQAFDGRHFIDDAIIKGARAIVSTPDAYEFSSKLRQSGSVTFIASHNPRRDYAKMAARFFGSSPACMAAVTGTNGKTSVADFARQLWQLTGKEAASVGTLGVRSSVLDVAGGLTTPDPMQLMENLATLHNRGVDHVALEASSHGLDQARLDGIVFSVAAFTNLSRDHLDYHKNFDSYFYAKARLFGELLSPSGTAVVNIDSDYGRIIADLAWGRGIKTITTGYHDKADIRLRDLQAGPKGLVLALSVFGQTKIVEIPLFGEFQAENIMTAMGLVLASGVEVDSVCENLPNIKEVPGRMDYRGETEQGAGVFIDYAHTPDGLATVLKAARRHNPSQLTVVFGCGGDRDRGKRPQMGAIAARYADRVIVTDDNPRSEDAAFIRRSVLTACPGAKEIGDRGQAIAYAIKNQQANGMVIVAGKGHEEGQIIGDQVIPFSDCDVISDILEGVKV